MDGFSWIVRICFEMSNLHAIRQYIHLRSTLLTDYIRINSHQQIDQQVHDHALRKIK